VIVVCRTGRRLCEGPIPLQGESYWVFVWSGATVTLYIYNGWVEKILIKQNKLYLSW